MALIRRLIAVTLLLLIFPLIIHASGADSDLMRHSLENARGINWNFVKAASQIERFRQQNGRLPNREEMAKLYPNRTDDPYSVTFEPTGFPSCDSDPASFATIGKDAYVLTVWRGEWMECYLSSPREDTLDLESYKAPMTGSVLGDRVLAALFAAVSALAAAWLWLPHKGSRPPAPVSPSNLS